MLFFLMGDEWAVRRGWHSAAETGLDDKWGQREKCLSAPVLVVRKQCLECCVRGVGNRALFTKSGSQVTRDIRPCWWHEDKKDESQWYCLYLMTDIVVSTLLVHIVRCSHALLHFSVFVLKICWSAAVLVSANINFKKQKCS